MNKNFYFVYRREAKESKNPDPFASQSTITTITLELESSDIEDENEEKSFRKYVAQKLNTINESGQISLVPTNIFTFKCTGMLLCYFTLIPKQKIFFDMKKADENTSVDSSEYVLCLVTEVEKSESLTLFKSDLDDFAQKAKQWIWDAKLGRKYSDTLRENLSSWFTYNVEYISRCVDISGTHLPYLLYYSLLSAEFKFSPSTSSATFIEDMKKFTKIMRLTPTSLVPEPVELSLGSSYDFDITPKDITINPFCVRWAEELKEAGTDFVLLRNIIEQQKMRVSQDVLQLRKLVDSAPRNYYSLYKAYRYLKTHHNRDILLKVIEDYINGSNNSGSQSMKEAQNQLARKEALNNIKGYLAEKKEKPKS